MDKKLRSGGMGVGYVTLIMIFAVICLTVLAVMSYHAAGANDILNEKSISYTKQYYDAESRVQEKLMQLDNAALTAHKGFFESDFELLCAEIDGVEVKRSMEGFSVELTEAINDRLGIRVSAVFTAMPIDGSRYRITSHKTISADSAEEEKPLGVWDGSTIN